MTVESLSIVEYHSLVLQLYLRPYLRYVKYGSYFGNRQTRVSCFFSKIELKRLSAHYFCFTYDIFESSDAEAIV